LVQHLIWTADRAGWEISGNRKLRARNLFYLDLGQLASTFPDEHPVVIVGHNYSFQCARQLLVQDIVWIADRAGCEGAGERIRSRRDLFHFFFGE
jgi:hypothetical protein